MKLTSSWRARVAAAALVAEGVWIWWAFWSLGQLQGGAMVKLTTGWPYLMAGAGLAISGVLLGAGARRGLVVAFILQGLVVGDSAYSLWSLFQRVPTTQRASPQLIAVVAAFALLLALLAWLLIRPPREEEGTEELLDGGGETEVADVAS